MNIQFRIMKETQKDFCVIDDLVLYQGYIPKKKFTFADVENIENEPSNKLDSPSKY